MPAFKTRDAAKRELGFCHAKVFLNEMVYGGGTRPFKTLTRGLPEEDFDHV